MSQEFDTIIFNTNISEYNTVPEITHQTDGIGNILDHINIFTNSLSSFSTVDTLSIMTAEDANVSIKKIEALKLELESRKRILNGLKKALNKN